MKKFLIIALCLSGVVAFADTKPFPGWKCKDVSALKAAAADSDVDAYSASHRIQFELMVTEIEAPDKLKTLKDYEQFVSEARERYKALAPAYAEWLNTNTNGQTKNIVLQYFTCRGDKRFVKDIVADTGYTSLVYYKEICVLYGFVPVSASEVKDTCVEVVASYIKRNSPNNTKKYLDKYLDLTVDDDDAVVVKNLKKFYRMVLPKLTGGSSDPWFTVSATIALALKSRGVEVK